MSAISKGLESGHADLSAASAGQAEKKPPDRGKKAADRVTRKMVDIAGRGSKSESRYLL